MAVQDPSSGNTSPKISYKKTSTNKNPQSFWGRTLWSIWKVRWKILRAPQTRFTWSRFHLHRNTSPKHLPWPLPLQLLRNWNNDRCLRHRRLITRHPPNAVTSLETPQHTQHAPHNFLRTPIRTRTRNCFDKNARKPGNENVIHTRSYTAIPRPTEHHSCTPMTARFQDSWTSLDALTIYQSMPSGPVVLTTRPISPLSLKIYIFPLRNKSSTAYRTLSSPWKNPHFRTWQGPRSKWWWSEIPRCTGHSS